MCAVWSEQAKLLIERRDVLARAEQALLADWTSVLKEVSRHFSRKEWICRIVGDPAHFLQLRRQTWPKPWGAAHYEVLCNSEFIRRGIVDLSFHIENQMPNQAEVCSRLRALLRPYSDKIHSLLSSYTPSMPEQPMQDILKGQLPLASVTPEAICDAVEAMMQTATFVDQAIFLAGKQMVWATGFGSQEPSVNPKWFGNIGGQRPAPRMGRLGSSAWRIDGTRPNATEDPSRVGSCCFLVENDAKNLIFNGRKYYGCLVARTTKGAKLAIWADGHVHGSDNRIKAFPMAFFVECSVPQADEWQLITWEAPVPPIDKVGGNVPKEEGGGQIPCPYDFAKNGIWVVLRVQTEDEGFLIDSIEIASCDEEAK